MNVMTTHRRSQRHAGTGPRNHHWPLLLIAAPAAVAIWSGWVGLGGMAGFGIVHPLPGIADSVRIDTAITLPVGVEAYGAYALWVWLSGRGGGRTLTFARRSAIGALALGCLGQVIFHLLAAAHWNAAPWPVVVAVACLPVVTLAFAAALIHMTRADATAAEVAESEKAAAEGAELAELHAAMEAERTAREAAEAGCGDAEQKAAELAVKAEALTRKLAAALASKRTRNRKPAGTGTRTRKQPDPAPEAAPEAAPELVAEPAPEPDTEETVDIDAEARILQLIAEGHSPSKAGVLAGRSDSYGRQVARKARELTEAAPKGQDPEE